VELFLSSITDPGSGSRGVFADEASLVVSGAAVETEDFESSLGLWTAAEAPSGSPRVTGEWARAGELYRPFAAITTRDGVLLGFGLEHLSNEAARARLMGKALASPPR